MDIMDKGRTIDTKTDVNFMFLKTITPCLVNEDAVSLDGVIDWALLSIVLATNRFDAPKSLFCWLKLSKLLVLACNLKSLKLISLASYYNLSPQTPQTPHTSHTLSSSLPHKILRLMGNG